MWVKRLLFLVLLQCSLVFSTSSRLAGKIPSSLFGKEIGRATINQAEVNDSIICIIASRCHLGLPLLMFLGAFTPIANTCGAVNGPPGHLYREIFQTTSSREEISSTGTWCWTRTRPLSTSGPGAGSSGSGHTMSTTPPEIWYSFYKKEIERELSSPRRRSPSRTWSCRNAGPRGTRTPTASPRRDLWPCRTKGRPSTSVAPPRKTILHLQVCSSVAMKPEIRTLESATLKDRKDPRTEIGICAQDPLVNSTAVVVGSFTSPKH